jgi:beta-galactosidase/beta-glucuronidase
MIRIHRNHPSIVVWSMGNEVFFHRTQIHDAQGAPSF